MSSHAAGVPIRRSLVEHLRRQTTHLAAQMVEGELEGIANVVAEDRGQTAEGANKADPNRSVGRARGGREREQPSKTEGCGFQVMADADPRAMLRASAPP
jgi:hypothetical protein